MESKDLGRLKRFAAKGGIGRCVAIADCVAEGPSDLMFFQGDEITVLLQFEEEEGVYLGYCEDVVGRFRASDVRFHGKLKKPISTHRSTSSDNRTSTPSPIPPSPIRLEASLEISPNSNPQVSESVIPRAITPAGHSPSSFITQELLATGRTSDDSTNAPAYGSPSRSSVGSSHDIGVSSAAASVRPPDTRATTPTYYRPHSPLDLVSVDESTNSKPRSEEALTTSSAAESDSDGEFGIGMQFIQGRPHSASTTSGLEQQISVLSSHSRSSSLWSDGSIAVPAWNRASSLEGFSGGLAALEGRHIEHSGYAPRRSASSASGTSGRVDTADEAERTGQPVNLYATRSRPTSEGVSSPNPAQELSASPIELEESLPDDRAIGSASEVGQDEPDHEAIHPRPSATSLLEQASANSGVGGEESVGPRDPPFDLPLEVKPSEHDEDALLSDQLEDAYHSPTSDSDEGGYYDDDVNIFDEYRYSRYSMMSRKSRKSVLPPPQMPTSDSLPRMAMPSPPSGNLSTSSSQALAFPTSLIKEDDVRSMKSVLSEAASLLASPTLPRKVTSPRRRGFAIPSPVSPTLRSESPLSDIARPPGGSSAEQPSANGTLEGATSLEIDTRASLQSNDDEPGTRSPRSHCGSLGPTFNDILDEDEVRVKLRSEDLVLGTPECLPIEPQPLGESGAAHETAGVDVHEQERSKLFPEPLPPFDKDHASTSSPLLSELTVSSAPPEPVTALGSSQPKDGQEPPEAPSGVAYLGNRVAPGTSNSFHANIPEVDLPPVSQKSSSDSTPAPWSLSGLPTPLFSPSGRPLTFLPHPNAPKPLALDSAPRQPAIYTTQSRQGWPSPSLYNALAAVVAHSRAAPAAGGVRRAATIHGRTEYTLLSATGPVRIDFVFDGGGGVVPPSPGLGPPPRRLVSPPSHQTTQYGIPTALPGRSQTSGGSLDTVSEQQHRGNPTVGSGPKSQDDVHTSSPSDPSAPIPRASFFPRGQSRPRSRSFSGFNALELPLPVRSREHKDDNDLPRKTPPPHTMSETQVPSSSLSQAQSDTPTTPRQASTLDPMRSNGLKIHIKTPSPLSLSKGFSSLQTMKSPPPSSPLALPPVSPSSFTDSTTSNRVDSMLFPPSPTSFRSTSSSPSGSARATLRNVASTSGLRAEVPRSSERYSETSSISSSTRLPRRSMSQGTISLADQDAKQSSPVSNSNDDGSAKSISIRRSSSLRSKISLSALRNKMANKSTSRDAPSAPGTPLRAQFEVAEQTVQVKEGGSAAEFELIRPVLSRVSHTRASEDRTPPEPPDRGDNAKAHRVPTVPLGEAARSDAARIVPADAASMEAHRARELKWISAMSSIPSTGARKSKKIRKLIQGGVPNSVRSVVWLYLTDSKARRMDGLYNQFCARGQVPASGDIERDAERCFPDQTHLRDPKGPVVTLLQAYLTMVPDLQYSQGLAAIAGTILLQSPEEDSFWTFIALMDNHLRGYFASNSLQMEVDVALFSKAVQAADLPLSKKLFSECLVRPIDLCRPWFSSLFALTLPAKYLHRVWDFFILDGVNFLFRVALAILSLCRKHIIGARGLNASGAIALLCRPPATVWPSDVEDFLAVVSGVRLREDDMRKMRPKFETSLKQQQMSQTNRPNIQGKGIIALKTGVL